MNAYQIVVGNLIEVRFGSPMSREQFEQVRAARQATQRTLGERRVSCVDMREVTEVMSPELADLLRDAMRAGAVQPLRSALLLPAERATAAMQLDRVIRECESPTRKAFRKVPDVLAWLDPVLSVPERARLRVFLRAEG
jgi:hypothetical protein